MVGLVGMTGGRVDCNCNFAGHTADIGLHIVAVDCNTVHIVVTDYDLRTAVDIAVLAGMTARQAGKIVRSLRSLLCQAHSSLDFAEYAEQDFHLVRRGHPPTNPEFRTCSRRCPTEGLLKCGTTNSTVLQSEGFLLVVAMSLKTFFSRDSNTSRNEFNIDRSTKLSNPTMSTLMPSVGYSSWRCAKVLHTSWKMPAYVQHTLRMARN